MRAHRESKRNKAGNRSRFKSMLQGIEPLENRNLMTVTLSNVHLSTDTGSSSTDKITSAPAITGTATGNPPPLGSVQVQFDRNNDGNVDGTSGISGGSFSYNPLATDSALNNWEAALTVRYRTRELDGYGGELSVGDWQNFNMTLDRVKPSTSGLSQVQLYEYSPNSNINLNNSMSDGITPDSLLNYQIISNSNTGLFDSVSINSGVLTLDYGSTSGGANITIRVTDQAGNFRDVVQNVSVLHAQIPPVIYDFQVTSVGGNDYIFSGRVEDNEDMTGQLVWIFVDPDIFFSATVQSDGNFSVGYELPEAPATYALAWAYDIDDEMSEMAWADII